MGWKEWLQDFFWPGDKDQPATAEPDVDALVEAPTEEPAAEPADEPAEDTAPKVLSLLGKPDNYDAFFKIVRAKYGALTASQVGGFQEIISQFDAAGLTNLHWLAYMLATTWHETWFKMVPIKEVGSDRYLRSKAYFPYYGRGYVQLTWKVNYKRYGIENNPEKALEPDMAAHIMIDGMTKGIYTGRALKHYFTATKNDAVNARRIINGTDKAQEIAGHYNVFYKACVALKA